MRSGNDEEVNNQRKPLFREPAGMERQPHHQHAQHCRKQQRMGQAAMAQQGAVRNSKCKPDDIDIRQGRK